MNTKILIGFLFILIGVGLIITAITIGFTTYKFIHDSTTANGIVVRLNAGGSHPQIEFTLVSGQKISYPQGGLIFGYKPGDHLRVLYNPNNPMQTACIDSFGALWFSSLFLSTIGIAFSSIGFLLVVCRNTSLWY